MDLDAIWGQQRSQLQGQVQQVCLGSCCTAYKAPSAWLNCTPAVCHHVPMPAWGRAIHASRLAPGLHLRHVDHQAELCRPGRGQSLRIIPQPCKLMLWVEPPLTAVCVPLQLMAPLGGSVPPVPALGPGLPLMPDFTKSQPGSCRQGSYMQSRSFGGLPGAAMMQQQLQLQGFPFFGLSAGVAASQGPSEPEPKPKTSQPEQPPQS